LRISKKLRMVSSVALILMVEYKKVLQSKQIMSEKKSENDVVLQEFKMLEDDANVYKLVGPVLAK
jgi:prefoldin beta subunit